jgi:hypothetical protein
VFGAAGDERAKLLDVLAELAQQDGFDRLAVDELPPERQTLLTVGGSPRIVTLEACREPQVAEYRGNARLVADRSVRLGAYYVQDYEPFFTHDASPDEKEALASFLGSGLSFTTRWDRCCALETLVIGCGRRSTL